MNEEAINAKVINKLFAELSAILSEKYGVQITLRAIPKQASNSIKKGG